MQLDANGDILFYIIDNDVLDSDGVSIGNFASVYQSNNYLPYMCMGLAQTSEIVIVQDPNSCNKYYVVSSATTTRACNDGPNVNPWPNHADPFVAVIDFDLPRPNNPNKNGAISSVEYLQNLNNMPSQLTWIGTDYSGGVLLAASKLKEDEGKKYRYVFVSLNKASNSLSDGIVRFKIGDNGMVYDGLIPFENQNATGGSRSEMELIELSNGRFRIACPYGANATNNGLDLSTAIYTAELDASGNVFPGSENTLYFYNDGNSNDNPFIHGIEFSPDGSKLFITHDISFYHDKPLEYYDFTNPNISDPNGNGIYSLNIASSSVIEDDFQYSQIELATDGKLYLGAQGRLASFSNPNNPSALNFTDNEVVLPNYQANYGGLNDITLLVTKSHVLPDQIDGMDYQNFATTVYNETSYTSLATGVWSPGISNNPWNAVGEVFIKDELIIPSGNNVTIQNMTFRFGPNAKVIIEQGAKLTIDGAILTNSRPCNDVESYWRGVQVYGTSNQHQYPINNPTYQGMLELKNGGTIENANKAVTNWKEGSWNDIGGVIKSTDGIFRNNRRGIEFMEYQNFSPNNPSTLRDNLSRFSDTQFLTDDNFIEGYPQQPYVTLWKVQGVIFENCDFSNNITSDKSFSSSPNEGIYSLDASYIVAPRCDSPVAIPSGQSCPSSLILRSSFTGLEFAVQVAGAGTSESVTITNTDFTNNIWGVRVADFDNVSINRNDFVIGNSGYSINSSSGNGVTLDKSTGFIVEENSVISTLVGGKTSGIVVNNSGPANNRLYKNSLNYLFAGTQANRVNRSVNLANGLQFLCNDYVQNRKAIYINSDPDKDGVRLYQGEFNPKTSSGNTFQSNTLDIENNASHINFYHFGGISNPNVTSGVLGPVDVIMADFDNTCESSFEDGLFMFQDPNTDLVGYESELAILRTSYNNLNYNYISLIDNGDTDILQSQIENNWSSDAWSLRNNLMQESPYLSTEALLTAAAENLLPNAMLLEVLLANPDATRGENFITELNEVTNNALPEYMLNYVRNNWDTETVRTTLEAEMSYFKSKIATTSNFIKYLEKSKDEHTYADRHNTVLMGDCVSDKIGLMDFFVENSEWIRADSVLQALNSDESIQGDLVLLEDYDNYITFRSSLGARNVAQLDSSEISYLETLAEQGNRASGYAENILCFFYGICYEKEMVDEESSEKMLTPPSLNEKTLEEIMYNITVYPNPASDFTSIKWEIYDELKNSHYKIFDLNGREMGSGAIEGNVGEQVIDTRSLTKGVYIINIYNDGIMKMNSKLIVSKEK